MPNNPLTEQELYDYGILRSITPPTPEGTVPGAPYFPAGYFLVPPHDVDGIVAWRKFHAGYITEGIIDPDRLGTGVVGDGNLYLADDGTWKGITISTPNLQQVTDEGNTTTNTIETAGTKSDYFLLDTLATPTPQQGMLFWDEDRSTVGLQMNGVDAHLGQDNFWYVKNQTGSPIPKGTAVMAVGALGASSRILVAPMIADGSVEAKYFLGITAEEILDGEDGFVTNIGKIRGIDTSVYGTQAGQILYCDPANPGGFTITQPTAPNLDIAAAFTVDYKSNGTLAVRALPGYHLSELHDVYINTPSDQDILLYNGTNNRWENTPLASAVPTPTLQTVTDAGNTTTNEIVVGGLNVDSGTLYVDSVNNRVGIGTTSATSYTLVVKQPSNSTSTGLQITQSDSASSGMVLQFITSNAIIKNRITGSLIFGTNDFERLRITPSGNVLIGTTTDAGYKLDVNGTARVSDDFTVGTDDLYVKTGNNRVGIGTTIPSSKLHIEGDTPILQLRETSGNSEVGISINHAVSGNHYNWFVGTIDGDARKFTIGATVTNGHNTVTAQAAASLFTINQNGGKVGIGTSSPAYKLHVNGTVSAQLTNATHSDVVYYNSATGELTYGALPASAAITSTQISNWDTAYGWGDHATAGYLTSYTETDTLDSVTTRGNTTTNSITVGGLIVDTNTLVVDSVNDRVGIGTSTPAYKLDVNGNSRIKGGGNTSGTQAFVIQNSDTTSLFYIDNSGQSFFNNRIAVNRIQPLQFFNIVEIAGGIGATSGGSGIGLNQFTNVTNVSGTHNRIESTGAFLPTSGNGIFNVFQITGSINQTGGANGITRGLYVNPTLTAAADWRSIEWSNNSGWGLYGAGTANNYLNGNVLIGTTTDAGFKLDVNGTIRSNNTITASGGNSTEWNTAYSWGDHSTQGYITGTTGFTGVFTVLTNPPGQQNLDIQNGLIVNVF